MNSAKPKQMNKFKFIVTIIVLFITTFSFGQNINLNQGYAEPKEYVVSIPYTEVKGKILIDVVVNKKKRKFILDTGAPTVISDDLYKEISPKSLGKIQISDQSGAKDSINVVSLSGVEMSDVNFKDIPAVVTKESKLFFECFGAEGFIGSNLLRNSVIQFDYRSKTVIITDNPKAFTLKNRYSNKMELSVSQSNPFVWIALKKGKNTATEKILFDTGDDDLYTISTAAYSQLTKKLDVFDKIAESKGSFSAGLHGIAKEEQHSAVNIPVLTFNTMVLNNVIAKTTYAETSRFGSGVLKLGKVTLDYKNKKFYMEPYDDKSTVDLKEKIWPIDPILEGEKLVIGIIWDEALKKEINLGDEILEFDGIDYRKLDFCQIVRSNTKSDKEKARLVIKDRNSGQTKTIEISRL